MNVTDSQVEHDTIRVPCRSANVCMLAEAQSHVAPTKRNEMRPDGVGSKLERIPIEGEQALQIFGPDDHTGDAVNHVDVSVLSQSLSRCQEPAVEAQQRKSPVCQTQASDI